MVVMMVVPMAVLTVLRTVGLMVAKKAVWMAL
jgi:hypothetical protein